jgi:hypothetical protein
MFTRQPGHRPLVEVLYVGEYPHHAGALALVERGRAELGIDTEQRTSLIGDQAAAERARFPGSPTIKVDGRDVEPGREPSAELSVACRLYRLEHRLAGQPAERWVRDALLAAGQANARPESEQRSTTDQRAREIMGDKQNAARVAGAMIKLSQAGQCPVSLDQLATHVGLPAAETARLLRLTGQERIDADACAQQPFFASAHAASRWLADHPQGRLIAVQSFHAEARRLVDRLEVTMPATPLP